MKDINKLNTPEMIRDSRYSMVTGVCAAIARRLGWHRFAVRIIAVALLMNFTILTAVAYIGLTLSIPTRDDF